MPGGRGGLLGLVLAAALTLAACTEDEPAAGPSAEAPTPTPAPTCLTGKQPRKEADLAAPAIAVKVENSPQARPQSGLEDAEVVIEEIVEGGITRFMAIFHCNDSTKVGPVRSARFDDPRIARPFTKVIAFSGANKIVLRELRKQKVVAVEERAFPGPLFRDPPGSFDIHNLFADTNKLRRLPPVRKQDPPAASYLEFGPVPKGARRARSVTLNFTAANTIEYRWSKGAWRRFEAGTQFETAAGRQIAVPNVLVQEVEVNRSKTIVDSAGNPSPDIDLVKGGRALLFRDGKVIRGSWKTKKKGTVFVFETRKGDPFLFAEGPTWVELVPSKRGDVKGSISFR